MDYVIVLYRVLTIIIKTIKKFKKQALTVVYCGVYLYMYTYLWKKLKIRLKLFFGYTAPTSYNE